MSDHRAEVAQAVHGGDVEVGLRRKFPCDREICRQITRADRRESSVIDVYPI